MKKKKIKYANLINSDLPHEDPFENYGSTNLISFKDQPLTEKWLLTIDQQLKQEIKQFLFSYFRKYGFPYPTHSEDNLKKDWKNLVSFDPLSIIDNKKINTKNTHGHKIFQHFCPHFYQVKGDNPSPLEVFNDDVLLNKVLENRLGISQEECFNITGSMLRQGLRNSKLAFSISIFKAGVAKLIYHLYTQLNDIVYDFSTGFGQRMLGALSCSNNLTYIGTDPWDKQINSLNNIANYFGLQNRIKLFNQGSETFCPLEYTGKISLAFSSPPYFNKEIYDDFNSTQCYSESYEKFLEWWQITVDNINVLLKPNGLLILNMSKDYVDDLTQIILKNNFQEVDRLFMKFRSFKNIEKLEPIVVYQKK